MKSLIVDDHKINYVLIKNLLKESFPEVTEIDEADSVVKALQLLESKNYDLLFLDMQLKDGMGFDILKEMTEFVFVIVISSHKDYAVEAFKYNVVDYLLKPINTGDFKNAVNKVFDLHRKSETSRKSVLEPQSIANGVNKGRLFVNYKNEYLAIKISDVLYIKAQGKYSEIHMINGELYISSKNLKEFEDFVSGILLRIHKSYLVNINCVVSYGRDTSTLKLSTGFEIQVSIRKREDLFRIFRLF